MKTKKIKKDMSSEFSGQVAIVTGGARGIGYAVALGLAKRGGRVCLIDLKAADLADAAKKMSSVLPRAEIMSAPLPLPQLTRTAC